MSNRVVQRRVSFLDDDGQRQSFDPGDEVPKNLMKHITSDSPFERQLTPQEEEAELLGGPNYEKMSYKELLAVAKAQRITFDKNPKKADVIAALVASDEGEDEGFSDGNDDEDEDEED